MTRTLNLLVVVLIGVVIVAWLASIVWPAYEWDLSAPSPDGRYDLVVLRGKTADFDDFAWRLYVLPHKVVSTNRAKGTRMFMTPTWRSDKYLIYTGYNYPKFRWAGPHFIEFDLDDHDLKPFGLYPFKQFSEKLEQVTISVVYGPRAAAYISP
jgi:hypothetical protein